jgi:hypothetical protein
MSNTRSLDVRVRVCSGFPAQVSGFAVQTTGLSTPNIELKERQSEDIGIQSSSLIQERPKKASFAFVYHKGPTIDRESKRLIKKHVMIDIGKARRKAPIRGKSQELPESLASTETNSFDCSRQDTCPKKREVSRPQQFSISRFSTTRDPFTSFPIQMTRRTRALVDYCELLLPKYSQLILINFGSMQ